MTCREVDDALITAAGGELSAHAQAHLATCEGCRNLASAIAEGGSPYELSRALRERVANSIPATITRVRPLAPAAFWVALFLVIFAGIGVGAAGRLGIYGWPILSLAARILIFSVLLALSILAAFVTARQMRPGARVVRGGLLLAVTFLAIETVFFAVFHDYNVGQFFRAGLRCLTSGLLTAVPAGALVWLLVRRGYILAPISAGCAIGAVAGLTGLFALELHCPILTIPHVAVWHVGVVAISAGLGAAGGWIARSGPSG
jgi:Negative regulator of sigma F